MSTIYVDAAAWDALTDSERSDALTAVDAPVILGEPAEQSGTFDANGDFTLDEAGPRWYLWDDSRLTEAHALALAAEVG